MMLTVQLELSRKTRALLGMCFVRPSLWGLVAADGFLESFDAASWVSNAGQARLKLQLDPVIESNQ